MNNNNLYQNIIERFKNNDNRIDKIEDYLGMTDSDDNTGTGGNLLDQINKLLILRENGTSYKKDNVILTERTKFKPLLDNNGGIVYTNNDVNNYITQLSILVDIFNQNFNSKLNKLIYEDNRGVTEFEYVRTLSSGSNPGPPGSSMGSSSYTILAELTKIDFFTIVFRFNITFDIYINDVYFNKIKYVIGLCGQNLYDNILKGWRGSTIERSYGKSIGGSADEGKIWKNGNSNIINVGDIQTVIGSDQGIYNIEFPDIRNTVDNYIETTYVKILHNGGTADRIPIDNSHAINQKPINLEIGYRIHARTISIKNIKISEFETSYSRARDCRHSDSQVQNIIEQLKTLVLNSINNNDIVVTTKNQVVDDLLIRIENNYYK